MLVESDPPLRQRVITSAETQNGIFTGRHCPRRCERRILSKSAMTAPVDTGIEAMAVMGSAAIEGPSGGVPQPPTYRHTPLNFTPVQLAANMSESLATVNRGAFCIRLAVERRRPDGQARAPKGGPVAAAALACRARMARCLALLNELSRFARRGNKRAFRWTS